MVKPHIKLKTARAARPVPKAQQSRDMDRLMFLFAEAVGMTPSEVMRDPHAARTKWKNIEARQKGARKNSAAEMAPLAARLGWTPEKLFDSTDEEIRQRIEQVKKEHVEEVLAKEHERVVSILHACDVTGQQQLLMKLVADGTPADKAAEYIYDVAAAHSDGTSVHNSHSPEGGHRQAIDYAKIYDRQNNRKGGQA